MEPGSVVAEAREAPLHTCYYSGLGARRNPHYHL
jgi:hypothetical protein